MTDRPGQHLDTDVAIVGSGFAGALAALALRQQGQRVVLLERGSHPRFAIGESTTPLTNLLIEELADTYHLPAIRPFSKWGTWQQSKANIPAGLKRGFTFMFHEPRQTFTDSAAHDRQLMVAASPNDHIADTHWYRPEFDFELVKEAQSAGAQYFDRTRITQFDERDTDVLIHAVREGQPLSIRAGFVIDASGPRGFLASTFSLGLPDCQWLPPTQGLYTHFEGVGLWTDVAAPTGTPPYRPDDAALHHVFPGGWIWVLRFNNGITSAGAAICDPLAEDLQLVDGAPAWERLMAYLPSVAEQFQDAQPTLPFVYARRVAFRCRQVVGPRWAMLPSAAGVIDPLLSTGFPLTLLGLGRLLDVLTHTSDGDQRRAALAAYERDTQAELDVTEQLVAALYATMATPDVFKRLSLLYFAAASFSETVRRLGRAHLSPGFLLHAHPTFGPELRACAAIAAQVPTGAARAALFARIDRAIEPLDTAGLLDPARQSWYPVLREDLIRGASKLHATDAEVTQLLARCGL